MNRELLAELRRKHRTGNLTVYLIQGKYQVPYESDYNWTIGYAWSMEKAEEICERLRKELKEAIRILGPFHKALAQARKARGALPIEHRIGPDGDKHPLNVAYWAANDEYREQVDLVMLNMSDKQIPYPYSKLIPRYQDGPIQYWVKPVDKAH